MMCMIKLMTWADKVVDPRILVAMSIASEICGVFRHIPAIYVCKVCIDIPKEYLKLAIINK